MGPGADTPYSEQEAVVDTPTGNSDEWEGVDTPTGNREEGEGVDTPGNSEQVGRGLDPDSPIYAHSLITHLRQRNNP